MILTTMYDVSGLMMNTTEQNTGWCQDIKCVGGKNVCDTNENCLSSSDCECPEGFICNPKDPSADFMGCMLDYDFEEGDDYCDTFFGENCKSIDCACQSEAECNPGSKDSDFKGCVYKIELKIDDCPTGEVCNDGVCDGTENCMNSLDCARCPKDSYCNPDSVKTDLQGCVIYENITDYRCGYGENCYANPIDCVCPIGFNCGVHPDGAVAPDADLMGCITVEGFVNSSKICNPGLGDNCLNSPACFCPSSIECDPDNIRADERGCMPVFECPGGAESCCGDKKCGPGECTSCPYDCLPQVCATNGICSPSAGENCVTAPNDCDCSNKVCNLTSSYANVKGCVPMNNAFCGDGLVSTGETSETCCLDAGCETGVCLPYTALSQTITGWDILFFIKPEDFICAEEYCGDGICSPSETSEACCLDCECDVGSCDLVSPLEISCIDEATCGDSIIQDYETSFNCCLDAGCPTGMNCSDNMCVDEEVDESNITYVIEEELVELGCVTDDDCMCYSGCGAITNSLAERNPVCPSVITDCTLGKAIPVCINNKCISKFITEDDNPTMAYKMQLEELDARLTSFNKELNNSLLNLLGVISYYNDLGETGKLAEWQVVYDSYYDLISRANDLKTHITTVKDQPSEANVNYIYNSLELMVQDLSDILVKVYDLMEGLM